MNSNSNSKRCAACKHLRRKCPPTCILSPYFPPNHPQRFSYVHKIYGASNVAKMIQQVAVQQRGEAADSLYYEAQSRINDPVYGCVGIITMLQQEIYNVQCELVKIKAEVAVIDTPPNQNHQQSNYYFLGGGNYEAAVLPPPYDHSTHQFPWNWIN